MSTDLDHCLDILKFSIEQQILISNWENDLLQAIELITFEQSIKVNHTLLLEVLSHILQFDLAANPQVVEFAEVCVNYYRDRADYMSESEKKSLIDSYYNLSINLFKQNSSNGAISAFQITLAIQPDHARAYCNLGAILAMREQFAEAISCYETAIAICPDLAEAYYNLGASLLRIGQLDASVPHLQTAIKLRPNFAEAYSKLGAALFQKNQIDEAITHYQKALQIKPNMAETYFNLGVAFSEQNLIEEAISAFKQAIVYQPNFPDAHTNLATCMLVSGDYKNGWQEYEWRWQRKGMELPPWSQPLWDGGDLTGKIILIWAEQGFGDTIQFIRYIPLVKKQRGGRIIVQCPTCLFSLLSNFAGIDCLVTENDELPEKVDCYAPLLSLPRIFETTLASVPNQVPYLKGSQRSAVSSQEAEGYKLRSYSLLKSDSYLKIGIVWTSSYKGNPNYLKFQQKKSCPLILFTELLEIPEINWYSLQMGQETADIANLGYEEQIEDLSHWIQDFADTAALIEQLDLVIAVDTAVAHLAGAMGKLVWVLLPSVADWRWLRDRADSPWYPTMRLFRQKQAGDWHSIFEQIKCELESLLESLQDIK